MSTIAENLLALQQAKNDIKSAIESKGQDLTDVPFTEYGNKITEISGAENLDTELNEQEELLNELETQVNELSDKPKDMLQQMVDNTNSCEHLFYAYGGTELDISNLDTSNVTNMYHMFGGCSKLKNIDISNLDTSNVTNMGSMFYSCSALTGIDVSTLNTSKVTDFYAMFQYCSKLTSIDLSKLDTGSLDTVQKMFMSCSNLNSVNMSGLNMGNVTSMQSMFESCGSLTNVNFSNVNTDSCKSTRGMFYSCYALTSLDLSSFDTSKVTDMAYMFGLCRRLTEVLGKIDMISTTSTTTMFSETYDLTKINLCNIRVSLVMGRGDAGKKLTLDTLLNTIKELWNMTGSTTRTLEIGSTNLDKLANVYVKLIDITDEMRAEDEYIDNKLPFVQCESTDAGAMLISEYVTSKNWQLA